MSAEEGAISNERNIGNKYNITNYLFQKLNYKSETYLIKIGYQKQDYRERDSVFLGAHLK